MNRPAGAGTGSLGQGRTDGAAELIATAPSWLDDSGRPDWVSRSEGTDSDYVSIGCGALFLYFLRYRLRFSWAQIVRFGGPTLAKTYQTLTSGGADAFAAFTAAIDRCFAKGAVAGLTTDNPFPMGGCAAISSEPARLDVFIRDYGVVAHLRYPSPAGWFSLTGTHGTAWENYPAAVSWAPLVAVIRCSGGSRGQCMAVTVGVDAGAGVGAVPAGVQDGQPVRSLAAGKGHGSAGARDGLR